MWAKYKPLEWGNICLKYSVALWKFKLLISEVMHEVNVARQ